MKSFEEEINKTFLKLKIPFVDYGITSSAAIYLQGIFRNPKFPNLSQHKNLFILSGHQVLRHVRRDRLHARARAAVDGVRVQSMSHLVRIALNEYLSNGPPNSQ